MSFRYHITLCDFGHFVSIVVFYFCLFFFFFFFFFFFRIAILYSFQPFLPSYRNNEIYTLVILYRPCSFHTQAISQTPTLIFCENKNKKKKCFKMSFVIGIEVNRDRRTRYSLWLRPFSIGDKMHENVF